MSTIAWTIAYAGRLACAASLACAAGLACAASLACGRSTTTADANDAPPTHPSVRAIPTASSSVPSTPDTPAIVAPRPIAVAPCRELTLVAGGDVLIHTALARQGLAHRDGFRSLWAPLVALLQAADIAYLNLEVPLASGLDRNGNEVADPGERFDDRVYTSYPRFNVHPRLARDLADSGIDIVSTANNHAMDRGPVGVDRTLGALARAGVLAVGSRPTDASAPAHATIIASRGIRLAFIACTMHLNENPDPHAQVLECFSEREQLLAAVRSAARDPAIDGVVVTPHFGEEYDLTPNPPEIELAHQLVDAGALLVLGSHPHVVQPWAVRARSGRRALIVHSLGNFVSGQRELPRSSAPLVLIHLVRPAGESLRIADARYVALAVRHAGQRTIVGAADASRDAANIAVLERALGPESRVSGERLPFASACEPHR